MKVFVYFSPGDRFDNFEGTRLRKNIKGALELNGIKWVESIYALPDIVHFISPDDEGKVKEFKKEGVKIVTSALYCEEDEKACYFLKDDLGALTLKNKAINLLENSDLIFVPSTKARGALKGAGIKNPNIAICSPGVNLTRFEKDEPLEKEIFHRYFRLDRRRKAILAVGNLEETEELEEFRNLAKLLPNFDFLYLGYSKKGMKITPFLKKISKKNPPNCHFSSLVEDDIYRSAIMNCSYLVFLNSYTASSMLALEAFAGQCQTLCVGRSEIEGLLENKKTCYNFDTIEELAKGIEDLESGKLKPLLREAYSVARKNSFSEIGQILKANYEKILK